LQTDGKIIAGGQFDNYGAWPRAGIVRLHPNGMVDDTFSSTGSVRFVNALAVLPDDKILVAGSFSAGVRRLDSDGRWDPSFDPGAGANGGIQSLAVTRDGLIYVGGDFSEFNHVTRNGIARLNSDGSLDLSFDAGPGARPIWALAAQPDNKLIVIGTFSQAGGRPRAQIARFNADGSLDVAFDAGSGPDGQVLAVALDRTGKIYVGGEFRYCNQYFRENIVRLNGDMFLFEPAVASGEFRVKVFTFLGQSYTLQHKNAVADPSWFSLPAISGDGTIQTLRDPDANSARRFYRVVTSP